jgi:hypothetical protein
MKQPKLTQYSISIILLILSLPLAFANPIEQLFQVIAFDPSYIYNLAPGFIDLILLMMFFVGISMKILTDRIGKKAAIAFGFMLAIGLSVWMITNGISLVSFGPVWLGIILFIMAYMIYYIVLQLVQPPETHRFMAASLAYIIIYPMYKVAVPNFFSWLEQSQNQFNFPLIALFDLLWWGLVIYLVTTLIRSMLPAPGATPAPLPGAPTAPTIPGRHPPTPPAPVPPVNLRDLMDYIQHLENAVNDHHRHLEVFVRACQNIIARRGLPPTDRLHMTRVAAFRALGNLYTPATRNHPLFLGEQHFRDMLNHINNHPHVAMLDAAQRTRITNAITAFQANYNTKLTTVTNTIGAIT